MDSNHKSKLVNHITENAQHLIATTKERRLTVPNLKNSDLYFDKLMTT